MSNSLCLILGDHLSESISSLRRHNIMLDTVLICEVLEEFSYVKYHKKKIAFILSAMRHFAQQLEQKGYRVKYIKLNDPDNTGVLKNEVRKYITQYQFSRIIITHPSEYYVLENIKTWSRSLNIPVEIREDDRFLCSISEFISWTKNKKQIRMEYFYRKMRKKYSILMKSNDPIDGHWNYDSKNRKPLTKGVSIPLPYRMHTIDKVTQEVILLVNQYFSSHFGDLETFYFAITRNTALEILKQFIKQRLNLFGNYQDAMVQNEPWMYHSHISCYLNCGLLLPIECIRAAEQAYHAGQASIHSVEGFIRQIVGWREYVRCIYWVNMPEYAHKNFFSSNRKLPNFYWSGNTKMNCLHQCITETKKNSYAHHIQRLMILGNFALISDVHPKYLNEWFLIVYADAYEWVELPNVSGMALFADGGYLASKPYASSGNYINKMSNYCKNCEYEVTKKNGVNACPFNYLYWNFLDRNEYKLKSNYRMSMMYKALNQMSKERRNDITEDSNKFLQNIEDENLV